MAMNKLKEILTLSPFIGLAIAISYLQGYWGAFDILAIPYLSFQELLSYSTAPLFGFVVVSTVGAVLGGISSRKGTKPRWISISEDIGIFLIAALLIYLDRPEKWLFLSVGVMIFCVTYFREIPALNTAAETHPQAVLIAFVIIFLLTGSFGYGRTKAEQVKVDTPLNVSILSEIGNAEGKMLGKLGSYYFYLDRYNKVQIMPERLIKRIQYL
jgi:hypothetical protein